MSQPTVSSLFAPIRAYTDRFESSEQIYKVYTKLVSDIAAFVDFIRSGLKSASSVSVREELNANMKEYATVLRCLFLSSYRTILRKVSELYEVLAFSGSRIVRLTFRNGTQLLFARAIEYFDGVRETQDAPFFACMMSILQCDPTNISTALYRAIVSVASDVNSIYQSVAFDIVRQILLYCPEHTSDVLSAFVEICMDPANIRDVLYNFNIFNSLISDPSIRARLPQLSSEIDRMFVPLCTQAAQDVDEDTSTAKKLTHDVQNSIAIKNDIKNTDSKLRIVNNSIFTFMDSISQLQTSLVGIKADIASTQTQMGAKNKEILAYQAQLKTQGGAEKAHELRAKMALMDAQFAYQQIDKKNIELEGNRQRVQLSLQKLEEQVAALNKQRATLTQSLTKLRRILVSRNDPLAATRPQHSSTNDPSDGLGDVAAKPMRTELFDYRHAHLNAADAQDVTRQVEMAKEFATCFLRTPESLMFLSTLVSGVQGILNALVHLREFSPTKRALYDMLFEVLGIPYDLYSNVFSVQRHHASSSGGDHYPSPHSSANVLTLPDEDTLAACLTGHAPRSVQPNPFVRKGSNGAFDYTLGMDARAAPAMKNADASIQLFNSSQRLSITTATSKEQCGGGQPEAASADPTSDSLTYTHAGGSIVLPTLKTLEGGQPCGIMLMLMRSLPAYRHLCAGADSAHSPGLGADTSVHRVSACDSSSSTLAADYDTSLLDCLYTEEMYMRLLSRATLDEMAFGHGNTHNIAQDQTSLALIGLARAGFVEAMSVQALSSNSLESIPATLLLANFFERCMRLLPQRYTYNLITLCESVCLIRNLDTSLLPIIAGFPTADVKRYTALNYRQNVQEYIKLFSTSYRHSYFDQFLTKKGLSNEDIDHMHNVYIIEQMTLSVETYTAAKNLGRINLLSKNLALKDEARTAIRFATLDMIKYFVKGVDTCISKMVKADSTWRGKDADLYSKSSAALLMASPIDAVVARTGICADVGTPSSWNWEAIHEMLSLLDLSNTAFSQTSLECRDYAAIIASARGAASADDRVRTPKRSHDGRSPKSPASSRAGGDREVDAFLHTQQIFEKIRPVLGVILQFIDGSMRHERAMRAEAQRSEALFTKRRSNAKGPFSLFSSARHSSATLATARRLSTVGRRDSQGFQRARNAADGSPAPSADAPAHCSPAPAATRATVSIAPRHTPSKSLLAPTAAQHNPAAPADKSNRRKTTHTDSCIYLGEGSCHENSASDEFSGGSITGLSQLRAHRQRGGQGQGQGQDAGGVSPRENLDALHLLTLPVSDQSAHVAEVCCRLVAILCRSAGGLQMLRESALAKVLYGAFQDFIQYPASEDIAFSRARLDRASSKALLVILGSLTATDYGLRLLVDPLSCDCGRSESILGVLRRAASVMMESGREDLLRLIILSCNYSAFSFSNVTKAFGMCSLAQHVICDNCEVYQRETWAGGARRAACPSPTVCGGAMASAVSMTNILAKAAVPVHISDPVRELLALALRSSNSGTRYLATYHLGCMCKQRQLIRADFKATCLCDRCLFTFWRVKPYILNHHVQLKTVTDVRWATDLLIDQLHDPVHEIVMSAYITIGDLVDESPSLLDYVVRRKIPIVTFGFIGNGLNYKIFSSEEGLRYLREQGSLDQYLEYMQSDLFLPCMWTVNLERRMFSTLNYNLTSHDPAAAAPGSCTEFDDLQSRQLPILDTALHERSRAFGFDEYYFSIKELYYDRILSPHMTMSGRAALNLPGNIRDMPVGFRSRFSFNNSFGKSHKAVFLRPNFVSELCKTPSGCRIITTETAIWSMVMDTLLHPEANRTNIKYRSCLWVVALLCLNDVSFNTVVLRASRNKSRGYYNAPGPGSESVESSFALQDTQVEELSMSVEIPLAPQQGPGETPSLMSTGAQSVVFNALRPRDPLACSGGGVSASLNMSLMGSSMADPLPLPHRGQDACQERRRTDSAGTKGASASFSLSMTESNFLTDQEMPDPQLPQRPVADYRSARGPSHTLKESTVDIMPQSTSLFEYETASSARSKPCGLTADASQMDAAIYQAPFVREAARVLSDPSANNTRTSLLTSAGGDTAPVKSFFLIHLIYNIACNADHLQLRVTAIYCLNLIAQNSVLREYLISTFNMEAVVVPALHNTTAYLMYPSLNVIDRYFSLPTYTSDAEIRWRFFAYTVAEGDVLEEGLVPANAEPPSAAAPTDPCKDIETILSELINIEDVETDTRLDLRYKKKGLLDGPASKAEDREEGSAAPQEQPAADSSCGHCSTHLHLPGLQSYIRDTHVSKTCGCPGGIILQRSMLPYFSHEEAETPERTSHDITVLADGRRWKQDLRHRLKPDVYQWLANENYDTFDCSPVLRAMEAIGVRIAKRNTKFLRVNKMVSLGSMRDASRLSSYDQDALLAIDYLMSAAPEDQMYGTQMVQQVTASSRQFLSTQGRISDGYFNSVQFFMVILHLLSRYNLSPTIRRAIHSCVMNPGVEILPLFDGVGGLVEDADRDGFL